MYTITDDDIIEIRDYAELQTDDDVEAEFVARVNGRNLRVTYYANRDEGPSPDYDIDDDDTGDYLASSRLGDHGEPLFVDGNLILTLARYLHEETFGDDGAPAAPGVFSSL